MSVECVSAPDELNDRDLVGRSLAKDPAAFEQIMRQNNRRLFRTARAILGDDAEAQDAVQSTYLRAFTALATFEGASSLSTWLTRIAVNESIGRLRKNRRLVSFDGLATDEAAENMRHSAMMTQLGGDPRQGPADEAEREEIRALIERAVDALPAGFRAVFMLRAIEELSVEETARCLGIPEATVKTRFHRARERLRDYLERRMDLSLPEAFSFDGARCDRIVQNVLRQIVPSSHPE
jgi:RNA polymerase sigma-70 factor, ECF subfamily